MMRTLVRAVAAYAESLILPALAILTLLATGLAR